MDRVVRALFATTIVTLIVAGPPLYHLYTHRTYRNFRVVKRGVLYRSGQLTQSGLERLIHDHGIRTVITLRDAPSPGEPPPDQDEEIYCRKEGLTYVRLSPRCWWSADGSVPVSSNIGQFLEVMDNPKRHPVLVHCFAGEHRTGAYCAIFRMEYDHWSNERAMSELYAFGYHNLYSEFDIRGFLEAYRPRWHRADGEASESQSR